MSTGNTAENWLAATLEMTERHVKRIEARDAEITRLQALNVELADVLHELLSSHLTLAPAHESGKEAQENWAVRRSTARTNAIAILAKVGR